MTGTVAPPGPEFVYLRRFLAPLAEALARPDATDIYVNRPGEIWIEVLGGGVERQAAPDLDEETMARLARQIAALSHQGINRAHPLLSATLPDGTRVQIVGPPATRDGHAFAFRKHLVGEMRLADYTRSGAFGDLADGARKRRENRARLEALRDAGDHAGLLAAAVRARCNILVSGGTSSGKTTFLNSLIAEIAPEERLVVIEDTPEIRLSHANALGLVAARSLLGESSAGADDLVAASLRLRPDRIIVGELRGPEAYAFLRAINTGHPGSMTTVHANDPEGAIEQIAMLVLQGGTRLGRDDVRHYVAQTVDVFVHLDRHMGRRRVAEIALRP